MLKKVIFGILMALIMAPNVGVAATAATPTDNSATIAQGLTVSPPLREMTIKPGTSEKVTIKLANPTKGIVEVYPQIMDFTSSDDGGDPLFLDPSEKSRTYSLSAWLKYSPEKITIAPNQIVSWDCTIAVPDNAGAGGHYGSVLFSNKPPVAGAAAANQVGISSMVASLLLISVPGDIKEQAMVSEFSTAKSFFWKPPIDITTRITNAGTDHIIPIGNVVVKNMFGTQVANYSLNETKGRILPDSTRRFMVKWDASAKPFYKSPIGRYTANLSAIYGQQKTQNLVSTVAFWVIPLWFIFTVAIIILLIIALIIILRARKKRKFLYH